MKKLLTAVIVAVVLSITVVTQASASGHVSARPGNEIGTALVSWSHRGSDCNVKYTENGQSVYKYETITSCDAGFLSIGHLVPGTKYQFTVGQGGGNWSLPVYAIAAGKSTTPVSVAVGAPLPTSTAVAENLPKSEFNPTQVKACDFQGTMQTMGPLNHDERSTGKCGTGVFNLRTTPGPNSGEITLHWTSSNVSDGRYHLIFGTESGRYTMGALDIGGKGKAYTVRFLNPGTRYYFKLIPLKGDELGGTSWEVSDTAH